MCLLDQILSWDEATVECSTHSHRHADNPLRTGNRLHALHGCEYGAQAVAVHGALSARRAQEDGSDGHDAAAAQPSGRGYLAALNQVRLHVDRLDSVADCLSVRAHRLVGGRGNSIYGFGVFGGGAILVEGRVTIIVAAGRVRISHQAGSGSNEFAE